MKTTKQEKKQKAIELMKKLHIYDDYILGFAEDDKVCFYENFGGFWAYQEPELMMKIQEIEEKHNCLVYAVTHEFTEFGECYDFLVVTDYKDEWNGLVSGANKGFYAFAYVWNKDDEWCSEFGSIGIQSFGGGIRRCA